MHSSYSFNQPPPTNNSWQLPLCANRYFSCEIGFLYVNVGSDALGYSFALGLDLDPRSLVRGEALPQSSSSVLLDPLVTRLLLLFLEHDI